MLEQYFTTATELPFLHYMKNTQDQICIAAHTFPVVQNLPVPFHSLFDTLFAEYDPEPYKNSVKFGSLSMLPHMALIIGNVIAQRSRRATANIFFVQSEVCKNKLSELVQFKEKKIIVLPWMKAGEIRATYWHIAGVSTHAVDGGIQISPAGLAFNPNYQDYFLKGYWK